MKRSIVVLLMLSTLGGCGRRIEPAPPVTIPLFRDAAVHFTPDDPQRFDSVTATAEDNGRIATTYREIRPPRGHHRVTVRLALRPVPVGLREVSDRWDRAGWLRLVPEDGAPVELMRFMTPYGGAVEHEIDASRYAPLLRGHCRFELFIDTWVSPGWRVDASLVFGPAGAGTAEPAWAEGVLFPPESLTAASPRAVATIEVPPGLRRVEVAAVSTGHCTDGRDADEFITKPNVLVIDGSEVLRWRPWRDDCEQFRARNPYCARWSDGTWSSDFARSGWCPGDAVAPQVVEATRWLTPGTHTVEWRVDDIRAEGEDGHFGYWRVSAMVTGWR